MDTETMDLYTQKLQEFVFDNDKVITVRSLASELNISIKDATELLTQFSKDNTELEVTYVITGILKENKSCGVQMVKRIDLNNNSSFDNVSSQILYSIQKNKNVDFNIIAIVDKFDSENPRDKPILGVIKSKNSFQREVKNKPLPPPPPPSTNKGKSGGFFVKQSPKPVEKAANEKEKQKTPPTSNDKKGISSMFDKVPKKENIEEAKNKSTEKIKKSPKAEKKQSISSMFDKAKIKNGNNKNESFEKESNEENKKLIVKEESKDSSIYQMDVDTDEDVKPPPKKSAKSTEKKKRQRKDQNPDQPSKRRKRIVERHDSDSDDMFANEPSDEEFKQEEPEEVSKPVKPLAPKNKIKKAVDKTYMDEEGYLVTRTEYTFESASEDEIEVKQENKSPRVKAEPVIKANAENVKTAPVKGKKGKPEVKNQPTLMSFFKKK